MNYGYCLWLLLGAYLLYHPGMSHSEIAFLYVLVVCGVLAGLLEYFSHRPLFQQWLNRWF